MLIKYLPFLFLFSCASAGPGPPPVDIDRLAPMLADMNLAEALVIEVPVVLRDSMRTVFYDGVLSQYDSNQAEFDSLMWLVRQEPVWVDSLYTRAGDILAQKSAEK